MQDDKQEERFPENWEEYYQFSIIKATDGNSEEGRWLFRDALGYLKRNHPMPEILRLYLVDVMQAALDGNRKDTSKNLLITKQKNRPTGEFNKRDYSIARWAHVEKNNSNKTLEEIKDEIILHFSVDNRTVERAIQKYSELVLMSDEFPSSTKKYD